MMLSSVVVFVVQAAVIVRHERDTQVLAESKMSDKRPGFCNYPIWTIPGSGSEGRCDHDYECTKTIKGGDRAMTYGAEGGGSRTVVCNTDATKEEVWTCVDNDEWTVEGGEPMVCPKARPGFCNYPIWTIPGSGSEGRCNQAKCTKTIEGGDAAMTFGAAGGESRTVLCNTDATKKEVWTCIGKDKWTVEGGEPMVCPKARPGAFSFCSHPIWTIPGSGSEGRCEHDYECTKTIEGGDAAMTFGAAGGESRTVLCNTDATKKEVWTCTGKDEWTVEGGEPMVCPPKAAPVRSIPSRFSAWWNSWF